MIIPATLPATAQVQAAAAAAVQALASAYRMQVEAGLANTRASHWHSRLAARFQRTECLWVAAPLRLPDLPPRSAGGSASACPRVCVFVWCIGVVCVCGQREREGGELEKAYGRTLRWERVTRAETD